MNILKATEPHILNYISIKTSEVTSSQNFLKATHPAGSSEVLYADQVPLQLHQLLEVLQPGEAVLEGGGHLRDGLEGFCVERSLSTGARAGELGVAWTKPSTHQFVTGTDNLKVVLTPGALYANSSQDCQGQQVWVPADDLKLGLVRPKLLTSPHSGSVKRKGAVFINNYLTLRAKQRRPPSF